MEYDNGVTGGGGGAAMVMRWLITDDEGGNRHKITLSRMAVDDLKETEELETNRK